MKFLATIILAFISSVLLFGQEQQEYSIPLSSPGERGTLDVSLHNGGITVEGYQGNEVKVIVTTIAEEGHEEAGRDGLRRVRKTASDLEIREHGNVVDISGGHSQQVNLKVQVPVNFNLSIGTHHNGTVVVSGVKGSHEINAHHGGITATQIGGSLIADTHHGGIKVTFTEVDAGSPMAFSTYHGDVDITLPASTGFNAKVKSTRGDIYTDFDVDLTVQAAEEKTKDDGTRAIKLSGWMVGAVGSGGEEYMFTTYHGDILMRKS